MDWMGEVALAALIVGLFAWIRADVTALRKDMCNAINEQGKSLRSAINEQGKSLRSAINEQGKSLRSAINEQGRGLRGDINVQGKGLRGDISLLGKEVGKLRERMAHLEGLLEGLREAVAAKRAA